MPNKSLHEPLWANYDISCSHILIHTYEKALIIMVHPIQMQKGPTVPSLSVVDTFWFFKGILYKDQLMGYCCMLQHHLFERSRPINLYCTILLLFNFQVLMQKCTLVLGGPCNDCTTWNHPVIKKFLEETLLDPDESDPLDSGKREQLDYC